jgi:hypothetical protein
MAKESGLGWSTLTLDDSSGTARSIINDIVSLEFDTPVELQEITGVDKSAYERLQLLRDFTCSLSGIFNDAATTGYHTVVKTAGTAITSRELVLAVSGQTLTTENLISSVAYERGDDGAFTISTEMSLANGTVPTWA